MKIEKMREKKREYGYTYAQIADLSGVPLGIWEKKKWRKKQGNRVLTK